MGQNWSPCTPPPTLHFDQELPGNVVSDVTRNNHGPELVTMHPPPPLYILIRSFLGMLLAMLRGITSRRDMGLDYFFKWPPWESNLGNISTSKWHIIIILVSTSMFSGSKNRIKPLGKILGHSYMANSEKFKMATGENHFMTKSEWLSTKFVDMLKCYSK